VSDRMGGVEIIDLRIPLNKVITETARQIENL
jgi:hypothetical protein